MPNPSQLNDSKTPKHDDLHLWLRGENITKLIAVSSSWKQPNDFGEWSENKWIDESKYIAGQHRFVGWTFKVESIEREVPVYRTNYSSKYLMGVCDVIITYLIEISVEIQKFRYEKIYDEKQIQEKIEERNKWHEKYDPKCLGNQERIYENRDSIIRSCGIKYKWQRVEDLGISQQVLTVSDGQSVEHAFSGGYYSQTPNRILIDFKPTLNSVSGIIGQLKAYRDCVGSSDLMVITYDKNKKYDVVLKDEGIHIIRIEEEDS